MSIPVPGPYSRRDFVRYLAGLGVSALVVTQAGGCANLLPQGPASSGPARVPRIGHLLPDSAVHSDAVASLRDGLRELGYVEGQQILIEHRFAEGRSERLPALAGELARLPVEVIVAVGTPAARAAKQATTTIPIVFTEVGDPVGSGLVPSLERPGGNVTGTTQLAPQMSARRLELLREAVSGASRVAVARNSASPAATLSFEETRVAARSSGVQLLAFELRDPNTFHAVFQTIANEGADVLMVLSDPLIDSYRTQIVDFAAKNRLPTMYDFREFVDAGGFMAFGASRAALNRSAASYVDKILKGSPPADLAIQQPTQFEFVINLKTARALGVEISSPVLAQSTEVIQ
jgi:putative ABC transport system substrate-binding protein